VVLLPSARSLLEWAWPEVGLEQADNAVQVSDHILALDFLALVPASSPDVTAVLLQGVDPTAFVVRGAVPEASWVDAVA